MSGYTLHLFWGGWDPGRRDRVLRVRRDEQRGRRLRPRRHDGRGQVARCVLERLDVHVYGRYPRRQLRDRPREPQARRFRPDPHVLHPRGGRSRARVGQARLPLVSPSRTLSPVVDIIVPKKVGLQPGAGRSHRDVQLDRQRLREQRAGGPGPRFGPVDPGRDQALRQQLDGHHRLHPQESATRRNGRSGATTARRATRERAGRRGRSTSGHTCSASR